MVPETHLKPTHETVEIFEHVSSFYVTNWRRRLLFFAATLAVAVVYGLVMNLVLNRAMERVAVETVGLIFFLLVAWPTYVSLRQTKASDKRLLAEGKLTQAVAQVSASRDFATRLQEKARFGISTAAINAHIIKMKAPGAGHIEALSKSLTQFVQGIESSATHEAAWRPTLLPIMTKVEKCFQSRSKAYASMVTWADRNNWNAWAVRCLPSLYAEIERVDNEVTAYVSRYVLASVPASISHQIVDKLCSGEILKVKMTNDSAFQVESIANTFCDYLRHDPSESDRAFLGTVVTLLSHKEMASRGTEEARRLRTQRIKILEDENVILAA